MLKTNSKEVKEKINAYIMENFKDYTERGADGRDIKFIKNYIARAFINEKLWDKDNNHIKSMDRQGYKSTYEAFKDWMSGLPSVLDADYYYNISAINLVGDILEQTKEERNKYSESQAEELMTQLLFRELDQYVFTWLGSDLNREALNRGE